MKVENSCSSRSGFQNFKLLNHTPLSLNLNPLLCPTFDREGELLAFICSYFQTKTNKTFKWAGLGEGWAVHVRCLVLKGNFECKWPEYLS